ncbi:MAG: cell envelope integrity protein CreD [Albidovulum sp.]|nr:cell envelope integrity protein CreD [Albidovulum sp.]
MFRIEPISLRFILVIGLILVLMIPLFLVMALVQERKTYFDEAVYDVAQAWSGRQDIAGPMLVATLADHSAESEGSARRRDEDLVFMPRQLSLSHATLHEIRSLGIYHIPVFAATVSATADFRSVDAGELNGKVEQLALVIGVSDGRGIRDASIRWNNIELEDLSSSHMNGIGNVIRAELESNAIADGGTATVDLELRGTERFSVLPVGDNTRVSMTSDWPDPGFDGRYLPDIREINAEGFTASWSTHALSRGFPAAATTADLASALASIRQVHGRSNDLGYSILTLNTPYRAVERSIKYGVLFIVMTLVSIVCIELVSKVKLHIIQYGVVGAGLVMFFLTVLSLSEHLGFAMGYGLAALILAAMIFTYVLIAGRNRTVAFATGVVLIVLYSALYLILQLDEYALLVGTFLLLALLAALMFATRSIRPSNSGS